MLFKSLTLIHSSTLVNKTQENINNYFKSKLQDLFDK